MSPVDEGVWLSLMEPTRARWALRAAEPGLTEGEAVYARRRERRLSQPYGLRLAGCARTGTPVKCGCGKRVVWHGCRSHLLCGRCKRTRHKRQGNRIRFAALDRVAHARPGIMPVLLTMTAKHGASVGDLWERISSGWAKFRAKWHEVFGRFEFCGVWEVTPGRDGLGHVHLHVIAHLPWVPGELFHRWWRQSCPSSSHMHVKALGGNVARAVGYLSKYLSKGIETNEFSPDLRARVLAGTYGKRWVLSSRRYWLPFVPCCPGCKSQVERATFAWSRVARSCLVVPDDTPDWWGDPDPPAPPNQLAVDW